MNARCAWCRKVDSARAGEFFVVHATGTGSMKVFKCSKCLEESAA
jgi:hypothetical protein